VLAHQPTSTPIERAVPATIFIAAAMSFALRSGILVCAISRTCAWRQLADLVAVGLFRTRLDAQRALDQERRRRRLRDERERAVFEDRDLDRDDEALLGSSSGRCTACRSP
jgi:hypothetical protein